jgi:glycosyltransferase involved in cell wall biosynthesis
MEKLSAVVITYNEERNIRRCIESLLPVADEIVILDSGSTDNTRQICESFPRIRFEVQIFAGYVKQKNDVLALASNDLVLSLDADEALSPLLTESILKVKSQRNHDGYTMNRLTSYCGQWIRYCGWYPDRKMRLFDRTKGSWVGHKIHEKFELSSPQLQYHIEGDLLHYSYTSFYELRKQTEKFGLLGAQGLYETGRGSSWIKLFYSPIFRFVRAYFFKLGFMDGFAGLTISWYSAVECFIKYNRLRMLVFANQK